MQYGEQLCLFKILQYGGGGFGSFMYSIESLLVPSNTVAQNNFFTTTGQPIVVQSEVVQELHAESKRQVKPV